MRRAEVTAIRGPPRRVHIRCGLGRRITAPADSSRAVRPELRRRRMAVGPYWLSPSPSPFPHFFVSPTLGFSDRSFDAMCKHATSAFPVLERRCRVFPQQPASRTTAPALALPSRAAPVHRLRAASPLVVTSHPATTRRALRRLLVDGIAHRPRHPRLTNRSPRSEDVARPVARRTGRSLLDSHRA